MDFIGPKKINQARLYAYASLAGLFVLAVSCRLFFLSRSGMPLSDEVYYIYAGLDILKGALPGDFEMTGNRGQPVLPLLYAFIFTVCKGEHLFVARLFSVLVASATVLPIYFALKRLTDSFTAFIAASLFVIAPFSIQYSLWAMNHAYFNFFWCCLLLCVTRVTQDNFLKWGVLGGLSAWLCYMFRADGLFICGLVLVIFGAAVCFQNEKRKAWHVLFVMSLSFIIASIPFWIFIYLKTGSWHFSWYSGQSVQDALAYRMQVRPGGFLGGKLVSRFFHHLPQVVLISIRSYSPFLVFLACVGSYYSLFSHGFSVNRRVWMVVPFCLAPFLFYLFFDTDPRLYHPFFLASLVFSAIGLVAICRGGHWFSSISPAHRLKFLIVLVVIFFTLGYRDLWRSAMSDREELKIAGEWLKNYSAKEATIFGGDRRMCYYAGASCGHVLGFRRYLSRLMTKEDFENFLSETKTDWIVQDDYVIQQYYPEVREPLRMILAGRLFRQAYRVKTSGGYISLYERISSS